MYFLSFLFFTFCLLFNFISFAQDIILEPVIVTPSCLSNFGELRPKDVITLEEIKSLPPYSLPELLQYFPSVDIRRRGVLGMQADLSIRGSNFEENLVLLDGTPFYNPQTGHHTMDLPLTIFDIERIEVLRGNSSSLYGQGGLGGVVNFVIKKPEEKRFIYQTYYGEYKFLSQGFSFEYPGKEFSSKFSYEYKKSSGYKPETDFIQRNFFTNLGNERFDFIFSFLDKDFGADSFYSNLFPQEEEHIQTQFGSFRLKENENTFSLYYHRHWDKFLLDRTRPGWNENTHTSYVYGGQFLREADLEDIDIIWGLDFSYDKITSTKLNKHRRNRSAFFIEWGKIFRERYIFNLGLRNDYYSDWGGEFSPVLNLGYLINPNLKLRSSLGRALRIPSYTELYYKDPGNIGNPNLLPEYAFSWEIGLDKKMGENFLDFTFFERKTRNTIDWIRENSQEPWRAENIGEIFFKGIELNYKFSPKEKNYFFLKSFGYTYLESERKEEVFLSKYVLDHLQHQFILNFCNLLPFGFIQIWNLSYKERVKESGYFILGTCVTKKISNIDIFLSGTNLTNTNYREIGGVDMPGRWIIFGFRFSF